MQLNLWFPSYDKLCNLIYVHKPDHFHILWNLRFPFVYKMNLLTMVFWFCWTLSCRVNPKWVIFHSLVSTDRQYMRNVITIDPSWLIEAAPHFYRHRQPNSIPHWKILVAKWRLSPEFTWQESILLPDYLATCCYFEIEEVILYHADHQNPNKFNTCTS